MNGITVCIPHRDQADDPNRARNLDAAINQWQQLKVEIIVADSTTTQPFNLSQARNNAATIAHGNTLIIADSDLILLDPTTALEAATIAEHTHGWVTPYTVLLMLDEHQTIDYLETDQLPRRPTTVKRPRGGIVVIERTTYNTAGGYDERFTGWGHEDTAFQIVLDHTAPHHQLTGTALHLWHQAHADRNQNWDQPNIEHNRQLVTEYERRYA